MYPFQAETGVERVMWFCVVFPKEPQGAGSDFPCCGGISITCKAGCSNVVVGFLATQTAAARQLLSLQGLWNLFKALYTLQRGFCQEADTEKYMIWKGHRGSHRKAMYHLKCLLLQSI